MKLYIIINSSHKMSKGFIAGQASHIVSLFLYHGYIKQDWQALPELPSKQALDQYFNTHITKIILKAPEEKLLELRNKNYLVIDDFNKQSSKTIITSAFGGLYDDENVPNWLKSLPLL